MFLGMQAITWISYQLRREPELNGVFPISEMFLLSECSVLGFSLMVMVSLKITPS